MKLLFSLSVLLLLGPCLIARDPLVVTHVANEGVVLEVGPHKVIIDGLFRRHYDLYDALTAENLELAEQGRGTYADIDVVLATHVHLDHFGPQAVGRHLSHNPAGVLFGTPQIYGALKQAFADFNAIEERLHVVPWEHKQAVEKNAGEIQIRVLPLKHGGRFSTIENHAYLVTMGGYTILHVGDADTDPDNFAWADLSAASIDVAVIPYWFFGSRDGKAVIRQQIAARHVIAAHIPPSQAADVSSSLGTDFPEAVAFTRQGQTKHYRR